MKIGDRVKYTRTFGHSYQIHSNGVRKLTSKTEIVEGTVKSVHNKTAKVQFDNGSIVERVRFTKLELV